MTKIEALNIIDQVLAQVSLNREGHIRLQEAINCLKNDINSENQK